MKLAIGYIHGGMVDQPFFESVQRFLAFDSSSRKLTLGIGHVKGPYLDDNRNDLAQDFLDIRADYLLVLDTDIEFQPESVYALIDDAEKHDREIESGLYFGFIQNRLRPVWFVQNEQGGLQFIGSFRMGDVVQLAAAGMGMCLIRRDVFEKIAKIPEYEMDPWHWFGRDPILVGNKMMHGGEDCVFGLRALKAGFPTWGNTNVMARHWKKYPLDFEMFRMMVEDCKRRGEEY